MWDTFMNRFCKFVLVGLFLFGFYLGVGFIFLVFFFFSFPAFMAACMLVGLCEYMCPFKELFSSDLESDN